NVLVAGRRLCGTVGTGIGPGRPTPLNIGIGEVFSSRNVASLLIARALGADFVFQPEATEYLHTARRDAGEFVLDRCVSMALHHHAVDALMSDKRGGRKAVQAAADDQNGDVVVHRLPLTKWHFPQGRALNNVIDKNIGAIKICQDSRTATENEA